MYKLVMFVGSRANFGRLYQLILKLSKDKDFELTIIKANTALYFNLDISNIKVYEVDSDMFNDNKNNMSITCGLMSIQVSNILKNNHFDIALCWGDRFETLGFAQAIAFSGIPLVHMEAGEFSGKIDNKIRWAITALSSMQLATSLRAAERLTNYGYYNSYNVGYPAIEYVLENKKSLTTMDKEKFVLVMYNPSDNKDELYVLIDIISGLDQRVYWINPNIDPGNKEIVHRAKKELSDEVKFLVNISFDSCYSLLNSCSALIGNASTGLREGCALGIPYFLIGDRQYRRDIGSNIYPVKDIKKAISELKYVIDNNIKHRYDGFFGRTSITRNIIKALRIHLSEVEHG